MNDFNKYHKPEALDIREKLQTLPGWVVAKGRLEKEFRFKDFSRALLFVNKIVNPIEENQNYPKILIVYDRVVVSLYTTSAGGITLMDFAMAKEMNELAQKYKNPQKIQLIIKKGTGIKKIAQLLEKHQLVRNRYDFEIYTRAMDFAPKIKAGEYEFEAGLDIVALVDLLVKGKVKRYKFTIPEGYNLKDVCRLLNKKKLMTLEVCSKQVLRVNLLKENEGIKDLEGYLYPETYFYESDVTADQLFEQMIKMFYSKVDDEIIKNSKNLGYSVHQLLSFASVIEKETGVADERPLIAGVFHNRLKIGMMLQSDPTVIYGIKNFDGNIKRSHLKADHPYNTYTRFGLPVGPICNPGMGAINAVINPDQTEYLYFVAKGAGRHYFSKNLKQHNQAVQYYQLKRGPKPEDN
ncbi:hypothetical protein BVY03_05015 [bacterium K02(2017)]|nr:hypothetical protein BVY03_05015 [bacterium K02(2017)]